MAVSATPSAAPGSSPNISDTNNIILVDYSYDDEEDITIRKAGENPMEY
jgi:hypothetical protein